MPTLSEKVEANARTRLTLPSGASPLQELTRYRRFLKVETHRLLLLHRNGAGGREICHARARMVDTLVGHVSDAVLQQRAAAGDATPPPVALVAVGGYGRAELNPYSDIDLMFLHSGEVRANGQARPALAAFVDTFVPLLWDIGLKPGHSVRTISECVREANKELQSKTALIEARLVHGNRELFRILQGELLEKCVDGHEADYLAARVADQTARHEKHGNSATMQEPNIKNGCGGLRDFQNLLWMAYFKYRTRTTAGLAKQGLLSTGEARQLDAAYDFLLRVRNELHYHTRRATDVLSKSVQPAIATNLGYTDRSPSHRIERFMRDYYLHSRNIYLITRTIEERLALAPPPRRLPDLRALLRPRFRRTPEQLVDGFRFRNGQILAGSPRVFREKPARLMRLFLHRQQRGLKLHPDLAQQVRQEHALVDRAFQADEHVRNTFLEILNQRGNVAPTLRQMHELGFLGKYLPEFGRLTCLVQHEFFHRYTADEHTLVCVEQLDRVWEANAAPYKHYARMFLELERPGLLYLALLLHDAGKGIADRGEKRVRHTALGGPIAVRVARRLHLDAAAAESLELLIRNHLLMAEVSQRRDLDDPAVIREFAGTLRTVEQLEMLTLHTLADSLGTSESLWNSFKDTLLRTLYERARQLLAGDQTFQSAEQKQRELQRLELARQLPRDLATEELQAHYDGLDPRYFRTHSTEEVLADLRLVQRFFERAVGRDDDESPADGLAPIVAWADDPDRGFTRVHICTWDRLGLFSWIAGAFSAAGVNILGSQGFTRRDRVVLDIFFVTDARTGVPVAVETRARFEALLAKLLTGQSVDLAALIAKQRGGKPAVSPERDRLPTRIKFEDDDTEGGRTLIEIETEDRLGLLYTVAQVFSRLNLDIATAKILTEKGAAIDTFYVRTGKDGGTVPNERRAVVERELREAIENLDH